MFFKVLIISIILVAVTILALGIKLLFDKNAEFSIHSCGIENGEIDDSGACASCQVKDIANCPIDNKK